MPAKYPAGYREVGCATVSFYDETRELLSAIRMARMPQYKKVDLKEMLMAEMGQVYAQRPDLQVVKIADVCRDNWDFLTERVRVGREAVDYCHATEHLNDGMIAGYGEGTNQQRPPADSASTCRGTTQGGKCTQRLRVGAIVRLVGPLYAHGRMTLLAPFSRTWGDIPGCEWNRTRSV